ncbi:MAG: hypothetical protein Q9163_004809 [Psora crenata]
MDNKSYNPSDEKCFAMLIVTALATVQTSGLPDFFPNVSSLPSQSRPGDEHQRHRQDNGAQYMVQRRAHASVIGVQGLGAHPFYTWTRIGDSAKDVPSVHRPSVNITGDPQNGLADDVVPNNPRMTCDAGEIMWLRDLLPPQIANARIGTYSYESSWRRATVQYNIRKFGEQLLNVLHQNRTSDNECRRPLVFIGHSFGGLVIKQALVLANHGDEYKNIRLSTAGIVFLGTPHQGCDAAGYGVWFARIAGKDKTLLESLKRSSPALHDLGRDFEASHRNTDVVCFYEDKSASYGPLQVQFVDDQSASLHGRRTIYLTTDHSGLNKFHGPQDENFLLLLPEIRRMVQEAPQIFGKQSYSQPEGSGRDLFRVDFSLQGIPVVNTFVARDTEMTYMTQILLPTAADQMRRKVLILHGLGGIGKTQLSVEFARRHKHSYSAIFWINGSSKESIRRSIADVVSRLPQHQISEISEEYLENRSTDVDKVIEDVLEWLSRPLNDQWLLIFDNLESVSEAQGTSILDNSVGRSMEGSSELIVLLHGLPLAINQAGSFMRTTGTSVSKYIALYNQAWGRLMEKQHHLMRHNAEGSVLTTWTLSFENLRAHSEDAANLLMLWAFLDNKDLWYELLAPALEHKTARGVPDWFARCASSELDFKECIGLLSGYSFIEAKMETDSFSMHPVLHHWCYHYMEENVASIGRLAVLVVASAAPCDDMAHYPVIQRRLLPHCDRVLSLLQRHMQDFSRVDEDLRDAFSDIADLFQDQLRFEEAEFMFLQILAGNKDTFTPDNIDVHEALAIVYQYQCRLKDAEELLLQTLVTAEQAFGPADSKTLDMFRHLALVYQEQGNVEEAEKLFLQALTGYEQTLGPEHEFTLETVNNLGFLYSSKGDYIEAEKLYLWALTGYEKTLGPEHKSALQIVNNLGCLYKSKGDYIEAEKLFLRVLTGYEKTLGPEYKSALQTVNNLGCLYGSKGDYIEAEKLFLRALTGYEKTLGPEHKSALQIVNNLGCLYGSKGDYIEAEKLFLRALTGYEKILGPEHKSTLQTVNNLGCLYESKGDYIEAEKLYLRVLTGYEKTLGPEDKSTLNTIYNLGCLYESKGDHIEAEKLFLQALTGYEKTLGPENKSILDSRWNLGCLYKSTSNFGDAIQQFNLAAQGYRNVLGPEHPETVDALEKLELCKSQMQPRQIEAESSRGTARQIRSDRHRSFISSLSHIVRRRRTRE